MDEQDRDDGPNILATIERSGAMNRHQRRAIESALRRSKKRHKQLALPRQATAFSSAGILVAAFMTGHWWFLLPAFFMALVSGALGVAAFAEALSLEGLEYFKNTSPTGTHIGMGSTVHQGAVIDPGAHIGWGATVHQGAVVETGAHIDMGATIESGALIETGAVVGMGATIESGATIEQGAVIGWGATVRSGALVGHGASIGAGSTVESNAEVEPGQHIGPGSTYAQRYLDDRASVAASPPPLPAPAPASTVDPRDTRIDQLCDRFETELRGVSDKVDEFLQNPKETVVSVRRTCHDLLRRERELRSEANPAEQERLNREATALETRIADETDDVTRRQLQGAVAAIEEQRRQRLLLLRDANRLEAEQTRLVWTMEGLVAHMVRLRSTQEETARIDLDRGLSTLRDEVASIASAMEQVQSVGLPDEPLSTDVESSNTPHSRNRVR